MHKLEWKKNEKKSLWLATKVITDNILTVAAARTNNLCSTLKFTTNVYFRMDRNNLITTKYGCHIVKSFFIK